MTTIKRMPLAEALRTAPVFVDGDWIESKDQNPKGDVRLIQLADIGIGSFINKSRRFLTGNTARRLGCTFLERGDVLIARMPDPIGRACVFPGIGQPAVTAVDICIVRVNPEVIDSRYLVHFLNSTDALRQISSKASGSTRQRISRSNLGTISIPLPPLEEQRRIAAILDKTDEINLNRLKSIRSIKSLERALFNEASRQNTDSNENLINYRFSDLLEIPLRNGISPSKGGHIEFEVLTLSAITRGQFIPSHKKKGTFNSQPVAEKKVDAHDFLICRGNGNLDLVGLGEFPENTDALTVFPDTMIAARLKRDLVDPFYFSLAWRQPNVRHQIIAKSRTTNGTFKINQASLESIAISLPSLNQQKIFTSRVKPLRITLREKENNVDSFLTELKKSLINNLL